MSRLGSYESALSAIDNGINQIGEIEQAAKDGSYGYLTDQPTFGSDSGGVETIEHMRDFEPDMMFSADYHYANDDLMYGTIHQGASQTYHTRYDRNVLITWMQRYNSIGLNMSDPGTDFNFGAYFAIRHYLKDWESDPQLETSEMAQRLDSLSRVIGNNYEAINNSYPKTPDDIDITHLLEWFDKYTSIGLFPDIAAQLVIRHLRNDWAEWTELETNELIEDLIERSKQRDNISSYSDESATSSTIFSVGELLGTDPSPLGSGEADEMIWGY